MTPQDALAAALDHSMGPERRRRLAAQALRSLPAGWRLTDEPEVTVEALARACGEVFVSSKVRWDDLDRVPAAILAALRGTS